MEKCHEKNSLPPVSLSNCFLFPEHKADDMPWLTYNLCLKLEYIVCSVIHKWVGCLDIGHTKNRLHLIFHVFDSEYKRFSLQKGWELYPKLWIIFKLWGTRYRYQIFNSKCFSLFLLLHQGHIAMKPPQQSFVYKNYEHNSVGARALKSSAPCLYSVWKYAAWKWGILPRAHTTAPTLHLLCPIWELAHSSNLLENALKSFFYVFFLFLYTFLPRPQRTS